MVNESLVVIVKTCIIHLVCENLSHWTDMFTALCILRWLVCFEIQFSLFLILMGFFMFCMFQLHNTAVYSK